MKMVLSKFPIKNQIKKRQTTVKGFYNEQILQDITNKVVHQLEVNFKSAFRKTFTSQIKKLPEFDKKGTDNKNKKSKMKFAKEIVKDVQNQMNETAIERYRSIIVWKHYLFMFYGIAVLKNFRQLPGKHSWWTAFEVKYSGGNFPKIFRTAAFTKHQRTAASEGERIAFAFYFSAVELGL